MAERRRPWSRLLGASTRERPGALDTAVLVFPLFLVYQAGIVSGGAGRNGADFVTSLLIELCARDLARYLLLVAAMLGAYAALLLVLRRTGRFDPRRFVPLVAEASLYAVCMGAVILLVIRHVLWFVPGLAAGASAERGLVEILVISAGAGLHEEFLFRAGLLGGLGFALEGQLPRRTAWALALAVSSLVFAAVHHVGPAGEAFTAVAFVYRTLAGVVFGVVYRLRGFAMAAWTHALYDLFVLSFS